MIQILKQRYIKKPNSDIYHKPMLWLRKEDGVNFTGSTVQSLFLNLEKIIEKIPEEERFNLHYTLCECYDDKKPRQFYRQNIIPFDIDGVDTNRIDIYIEPICTALGVHRNDIGIVASGNGLHFLVGLETYIEDPTYFKETKNVYKIIADRINNLLKNRGLPGEVDTGLWSPGHTLRLPGTKNIKTPETGYSDKNSIKDCVIIQRIINLLPQTDIYTIAKVDKVRPEDCINEESVPLGGTFPVDNEGVLNECDFLLWCKNNPEEITEPYWFSMVSVIARLENGSEIVHQYSQGHPSYDYHETEEKIARAKAAGKPQLCTTIQLKGFDCSECKHFGRCKSPISIKSENYIATKDTGFRYLKKNKEGDLVPGPVATDDLVKYFNQLHPFICSDSGSCYVWNNTFWELRKDRILENFAEITIVPAPKTNEVNEFVKKVLRTNVRDNDWFDITTEGRLNLRNGVFDIKTRELLPHSEDFGFSYCSDFDYDPEAECPRWNKFMQEITKDRKELEYVLQEYAGYAFSNSPCIYGKSILLLGEGANGKSTWMNTLTKLAGEEAWTSFTFDALKNEHSRISLKGKLFNISEETPRKAFLESDLFKALTTGGRVTGRYLYKDTVEFKNKAKLIFAANDLPYSSDVTYGFFRRIIIVPFDAWFSHSLGNIDIHIEDKLEKELSGILNWVIEGFLRLEKQGRFTENAILDDKIEEYKALNNPLIAFTDHLKVISYNDETDGIEWGKLYRMYVSFCQENGIRYTSASNQLPLQLNKIIPDFKERRGKKRINGVPTVYYRGIFPIEEETPF